MTDLKMCPSCGYRCLPPTVVLGDKSCPHCKAIQEAHTAGANEMVERCVERVLGRGQVIGQESEEQLHIARELRALSPDPDYRAKIEAGVREECAKAAETCQVIHGDHYAAYYGTSNDAIDIAKAIRTLGPLPADWLEKVKREAVEKWRDALGRVIPIMEAWDFKFNFDRQTKEAITEGRALLADGEEGT